RAVLGLLRTEGARFNDAEATPRVFDFPLADLARTRRRDNASPVLPIAFETGAFDPLVYQLRIESRTDALDARPRESGISISRRYLDPGTQSERDHWTRGVPTEAQLWIATSEEVPESRLLLVEDALPAGAELLEIDGLEGGEILWSQIDGSRLRFVIRMQGSGIHALRYTLLARAPGEFGVPGATVRTIYAARASGRSAPSGIVVE
ncbi:MAG: hypothetical protein KC729_21045, partial [Candidatus Eisenbacteria bacterium]|nr:hypothetical protein [Candidatus Eisenbacteria bacterium]